MHRLKRLFPAFDSGEDAAWIGAPDEWFWIGVVLRDEAIDGGFKVVDGSENTGYQAPAREFGEKDLDGVEPGSAPVTHKNTPPSIRKPVCPPASK